MDISAAGQQQIRNNNAPSSATARVVEGAQHIPSDRPVEARVVSVQDGRATLAVGDQRVVVESQNLRQGDVVQLRQEASNQGQQVQARITTVDNPAARLASLTTSLQNQQNLSVNTATASTRGPVIQAGQVIQANVIGVNTQAQTIQLNIAGVQIEAPLPQGLQVQAGSGLSLQVLSTQGTPQLQILGVTEAGGQQLQSQLQQLSTQFQPGQQSLGTLASELNKVTQAPNGAQLAPLLEQISQALDQLGSRATGSSTRGSTTATASAAASVVNNPVSAVAPTNQPNPQQAANSATPVTTGQAQVTNAEQQLQQAISQLVQLGQNNALESGADRVQRVVNQLLNQPSPQQQLLSVARELQGHAQLPANADIQALLQQAAGLAERAAQPGFNARADRQVLQQLNPLIRQLQASPQADTLQTTVNRLQEAFGQLLRPNAATGPQVLEQLRVELNQLAQMPRVEALRPELVQLTERIDQLMLRQGAVSADRVQQAVDQGGGSYEARLARVVQEVVDASNARASATNAQAADQARAQVVNQDLKGMLMQVMQRMDTQELHQTMESLSRALSTHLNHVEGQQASNALAQMSAQPVRVEVPMEMDGRLQTLLMSISAQAYSGSEGDGESPSGQQGPQDTRYRVLFMMDTEGLGQTRIDASLSKKNLTALFYVEDPVGLTQMKKDLPDLRTTFNDMGYQHIHVEAKAMQVMAVPVQEDFREMQHGPVTSVNLLDVFG